MTNVLLPVRAHEADSGESVSPGIPDGEAIHPLLSPELALVDPDLAAVARMLLPDPVVPERTRPTSPALRTAPPRPLAPPEQGPAPSTPTRVSRIRLAAVAATGLAAFAAGAFGFALAAEHGVAEETRAGADASRAALRAQAARQARATRTFTWPTVPAAERYRFEIRRVRAVVFETTKAETVVELPARIRFSPGRYSWSVTPIFENRGVPWMGRPLVEGAFQVPSS